MRVWLISLLLLTLSAPVFAAPDYAREQRWANEITPGIVVGDPMYLEQKNGHKFLGLYAEATNAKMGVVVVHGMGIHPDWGLIGTLRQRLVDDGYTTLSIQMPVLAVEAPSEAYPPLFPDAAERLRLAVAYLKAMGYKRIAIVSHSNGSRMTRVYMATNPPDVSAWVALSLTQGDTFAGVKAPVFDLSGQNDLPHVLASTAKRKASLANADHFFAGQEEAMVTAVKGFLDGLK
jgi:triacylglycerol esterase/lipase EstA (alpha/beta hydrolase family)